MKYLLLLIPGLGDVPQESLRSATPLEAANAPVLNQMAREGQVGLVNTVPKGLAPTTLASMLTLLGYPPGPYLTGRGWFEALSAGADLAEGEWAFRLQFLSVQDGVLMDPRGASPTEQEATELLEAVSKVCAPLGWRFLPGHLHSHLAMCQGDFEETLTSAPWDIRGEKLADHQPQGKGASLLIKLMETANAALSKHPVNHARKAAGKPLINAIWPWGGGCDVEMPGFTKTFGKHAAMISASPLARGVAIATGMELADPENPSRRFFRDPSGRIKRVAPEQLEQDLPEAIEADAAPQILESAKSAEDALMTSLRIAHGDTLQVMLSVAQRSLVDFDFVVVDLELVREAALQGSPLSKRLSIELVDQLFIAPLVEYAKEEELRVALISTLGIDSNEHRNLADPSPFLIWGANVDACNVPVFNERVLERTSPQIDQGVGFIDLFISAS